MSVLIGWGLLAVYVVGYLPCAVVYMRHLAANHAYCHGESRDAFKWTRRHYCIRYDRPGCWRTSGEVGPNQAALGSAIALLWPLFIVPAVAWKIAARKSPHKSDAEVIARMERELGIT